MDRLLVEGDDALGALEGLEVGRHVVGPGRVRLALDIGVWVLLIEGDTFARRLVVDHLRVDGLFVTAAQKHGGDEQGSPDSSSGHGFWASTYIPHIAL